MMITPVTRSTIQGTVIEIIMAAVGIALALIHHHVSMDIVLCHDPMLGHPPYKQTMFDFSLTNVIQVISGNFWSSWFCFVLLFLPLTCSFCLFQVVTDNERDVWYYLYNAYMYLSVDYH